MRTNIITDASVVRVHVFHCDRTVYITQKRREEERRKKKKRRKKEREEKELDHRE